MHKIVKPDTDMELPFLNEHTSYEIGLPRAVFSLVPRTIVHPPPLRLYKQGITGQRKGIASVRIFLKRLNQYLPQAKKDLKKKNPPASLNS